MPKLLRRTPSRRTTSVPLFGHSGFVEGVLAIPNGLLVSVDAEGEVIVWDVDQRRPAQQFSVSASPMRGVGAIPGTEDIAVWGWEGALLRLSVPDLTGIVRVDIHDDRILSTTFGFMGERRVAATASMDNTAAITDIDSGEVVFRTEAHGFWVIDAYVWSDHLVTVSRDGTIRLFDATGEALELFRLEGGHFVSSAYVEGKVVAASIDGSIMTVELGGREATTFDEAVAGEPAIVAFDGASMVVGDCDGVVKRIAWSTGEVLAEAEVHSGGVLGGTAGAGYVVTYALDRVAAVLREEDLELVRKVDAHDNLVSAATFLGNRLVTASADMSIRLHDPTETSEALNERHASLVKGMNFVDGQLISWGYGDEIARAWNPLTGTVSERRLGHRDQVTAVEKLADGRWVSASHDGSLRVSSTFEGKEATSLGLANGIRSAALTGSTTVALGTMIGALIHLDVDAGEQWRFENGAEIFDVEADPERGMIAFTDAEHVCLLDAEGELVARRPGKAFVLDDGLWWVFGEGRAYRYDLEDGETTTFELPLGKIEIGLGGDGGILALDAGGRMVVLELDGSVRWEARLVDFAPTCVDLSGNLVCMGWNKAGVAVLSIATGEVLLRDEGDPDELIVDVCADVDTGRVVAVGWDSVRLYDLHGGEPKELVGLNQRPDGAWFVGETIWLGGFGSALYVWEPSSNDVTTISRHQSVTAGIDRLGDGRLVSWGWDGRVVVDALDQRFQSSWGGHGSFVYGFAMLEGVGLISWSYDGTARVWDDDGREKETLRTRGDGITAGVLTGRSIWLGTYDGDLFAWRPDEQKVALFESEGWHRGSVQWLVASDEIVASACRRGQLGIWDSVTSTNLAFWDVPESGGFASLAMQPGGRLVAAGGERGKIIVVDTLECVVSFEVSAHGAEVHGLEFAPDADVLFSVSQDGTLAAWSLEGELLDRARLDGEGYSLAVAAGGQVAVGDGAGRVLFFDFANEVH